VIKQALLAYSAKEVAGRDPASAEAHITQSAYFDRSCASRPPSGILDSLWPSAATLTGILQVPGCGCGGIAAREEGFLADHPSGQDHPKGFAGSCL
jgi:hypothetical protein